MTQVITSTAGRYEVQEVEFGHVYKWHPETVVIECACGERPTLTSSMSTCECGVDHTALVQEWLAVRKREGNPHPWRHAGDTENTGIPY